MTELQIIGGPRKGNLSQSKGVSAPVLCALHAPQTGSDGTRSPRETGADRQLKTESVVVVVVVVSTRLTEPHDPNW
jgi:hypothetical protein